jgi:hypothetical protein
LFFHQNFLEKQAHKTAKTKAKSKKKRRQNGKGTGCAAINKGAKR